MSGYDVVNYAPCLHFIITSFGAKTATEINVNQPVLIAFAQVEFISETNVARPKRKRARGDQKGVEVDVWLVTNNKSVVFTSFWNKSL